RECRVRIQAVHLTPRVVLRWCRRDRGVGDVVDAGDGQSGRADAVAVESFSPHSAANRAADVQPGAKRTVHGEEHVTVVLVAVVVVLQQGAEIVRIDPGAAWTVLNISFREVLIDTEPIDVGAGAGDQVHAVEKLVVRGNGSDETVTI